MTTKPTEEIPIPAIWFLLLLATIFFPVSLLVLLHMWLWYLPRERRRRRAISSLRIFRVCAQECSTELTEHWAAECLALMLGRWPSEDEVAKVFKSGIPH